LVGELFVIQNGLVFKRPVALGEAYGDLVEVISGLKEGEEIAVDRVETLKDGAPVKTKPDAASAPAQKPDEERAGGVEPQGKKKP
ncbi:MAG: hypothetical protein HY042_05035, partial [Spirochaetia bacterium]|nr:hypothetical protein [Spirochaetia bacterium]